MPTDFPASLDALTNPSASDKTNSASVPHATQHANLNDAVEALQSKVGVDDSAVVTSLDYLVKNSIVKDASGNKYRLTVVLVDSEPTLQITAV